MLELEDHGEIRPKGAQQAVQAASERLSRALEQGAALSVPPRTIERLIGILLTNSFGVRGTSSASEATRRLDVRPHALALSLPSALFNHSCAPNCHTDHRLINGQLTFRALRRIDPGEECTIAYVATEEPTYWRRRALLRSKLFLCTCAVCTDPTDGERCGGSLVCKACNQGWLREGSSSAIIGTGGDWVCSRAPSSCSGSMRLSELIAWDDAQRRRLEECIEPTVYQNLESREASLAAGTAEQRLLRFIRDLEASCHPNHAILLQARLALVCFGYNDDEAIPMPGCSGDGAVSRLQKKLAAAESALLLAERILPPSDAQKGDLYFQIGLANHSLARLTFSNPSSSRSHKQAAAERMRGAAEAMLRSAAQFAAVMSEGADAPPARSAKDFARLCMQQVAQEKRRA